MTAPARTAPERKQDALRRLEHDVDAWVATAGDGGPYLVPLSYLWDGQTLLFATPEASPTICNLRACGKARVGIGPTRDLVLIEGTAILPVLTLVPVSVGPYIYSVRTMTMTVAQEDHVVLARAKGLPERRVTTRHILRVAAPPIVTGLLFGLAGSLSGSILIETIFNWRGMGRLYFDAITGTPDEGLIVALTFVFTLMYVIIRFVLDVLYVILDPRVRY